MNTEEIKKLVEIAHKAEKSLYYPYVLNWSKINNEIIVTSIQPFTTPIEYYNKRNRVTGTAHHPGIKIGRVKFFDPKHHELSVSQDEVIFLKSLTKNNLEKIKNASALIVEDEINSETKHFVKHYGIPTLTNVKDAAKTYKNGEVVTVNATSGHIQKGSMLINS